MSIKGTKDRVIAKFYGRFPALVKIWARTHQFVTNVDTAWTPLLKDLRDAQVALVTTAGIHLRSHSPYDMRDKEGDPTFRQIPSSTSVDDVMITHNYYDHRDADQDINVVFPIGRLKELESEGMIGRVAPRHFSFMGHILGHHIDTLVNQTAPEVAGMLKADGVDAVFLTPAWGTCNQSVGLIQRAIEAEGVPTISISLNRRITEKVKPPRALLVDFPMGHPTGNPFDYRLQKRILAEALRYLRDIAEPGTIVDLTETYHIKAGKCTVCEVE